VLERCLDAPDDDSVGPSSWRMITRVIQSRPIFPFRSTLVLSARERERVDLPFSIIEAA